MYDMIFWSWWIVAGALLVGELLTTTTYLLWMAVAAMIVGLVKWLWPSFDLVGQLLLFAGLAIFAVYVFRRYQKKPRHKHSDLNNRAEQMIGRIATLDSTIINGSGHVKFGESTWLVVSDVDLPVGTKIKVIAAQGTILRVAVA